MTEPSVGNNYRAELFGAGECEEAPFWLSSETPDGGQRSEVEALKILNDFWGEPDATWKVNRVQMHVGFNEYGDLRVQHEREGLRDPSGPFDFWRIDEG